MSAIESSVLMFTNIVTLAESNIAHFFLKVDEAEDNAELDTLSIAALAEQIGTELGIKQQECLYSICLYLKNRPELEIRAGKNGGIRRVGDNRSKTIMTPKECALKNYDAVKTCAFTVINEEFDKADSLAEKQNLTGKIRLNFQDLSQIIADKLKIKQYASYHCLKSYIQDERADLMIELGRHGGLVRK